jgi:hypothetical protein
MQVKLTCWRLSPHTYIELVGRYPTPFMVVITLEEEMIVKLKVPFGKVFTSKV